MESRIFVFKHFEPKEYLSIFKAINGNFLLDLKQLPGYLRFYSVNQKLIFEGYRNGYRKFIFVYNLLLVKCKVKLNYYKLLIIK